MKKLVNLIFISTFLLTFTGCGVEKGPNPDISKPFQNYTQENKLAKENDGYCDNIVYENIVDGYNIQGNGNLWGDITLCEINLKDTATLHIKGNIEIEQGNYKIIKINEDNQVENIVEDENTINKEITFEEGKSILKIVGKPVSFKSLNFTLELSDSDEEESEMILKVPLLSTSQNESQPVD